MLLHRNHLLSLQDLSAHGALGSVGESGLGTGGLLALDNFGGVALRGNLLLLDENGLTDGALLSLGLSGLGTGGLLPRDWDLGVSRSWKGHRILCHRAANGTPVFRGIPIFGACGGLGCSSLRVVCEESRVGD